MRNTFFILLFLFTISCSNSNTSKEQNPSTQSQRSFLMGFTPWLYAATTQAETDVYNFINTSGDLVAHHIQQGVPFNQASTFPNFANYETNIQNEINNRVSLTTSGKTVYLAIDSLNPDRSDLTDNWGTSSNMPRTAPWDVSNFDDVNVITSYTNFALELIARLNPTYFNYAPEVSELMLNSPAKYNEFKIFAQNVYTSIKSAYPNLKLMTSIALKTPGSAEMNTVTTAFADISAYNDVVGISTYGYAFYGHPNAGDPANLPSAWLSQITTIAPNKPYAIVETGWIAEDLSIPAFSLSVLSNENYQRNYLEKMFNEADSMNMEAIIWFTSYDFDVLWSNTLGSDDLSKIWRDSGLFDESLTERTALNLWNTWYSYEKK